MAGIKLAKAVEEFLSWFLEVYGEIEVNKEQADLLFAGTKQSKVKDLTTPQLLQFSLMMSRSQLDQAMALLDQHQIEALPGPNRAARRAKK